MLTSVTVDCVPTHPLLTEPPSRSICAIAGCSIAYRIPSSGRGVALGLGLWQPQVSLNGDFPVCTGNCEASRPTKFDDADTSGRTVAVESNNGNAISERRLPILQIRGQHSSSRGL